MNTETVVLLEKHFDTAFAAPDGIKKLRELILTLAMQGKLVPQDPTDRPASELLKAIEFEKQNLITGNSKKTKSLPSIKPEEKPFELPDSWQWARFGDLVQVINGKAYKQNELLDVGTPVLRVGNLFTSKHWYYSNLLLEEDKRITTGDLIYAWSASFGPFIWNGGEVIYHYHIWKLKFFLSDIPEKKYLYNYLLEATEKIKASGNGIAMIHMTKERMEKLLVPVPPLEEQHRIVAEIDRLMARCDELEKLRTDRNQKRTTVHTAAIDRLLKAQDDRAFSTAWSFITQHFSELYSVKENVTELRKVILQLAVMGKLVPQDPNDNESIQSLIQEIIDWKTKMVRDKIFLKSSKIEINRQQLNLFKLPSSWCWTHIGIICGSIVPIRDKPKSFSGGYPWVTLSNFDKNGIKLLSNHSGLGLSDQEVREFNARIMPKNSVLMSCVGSFGLVAVIEEDVVTNQQIHGFVVPAQLSSEYVAYVIKTQKKFLEDNSTSTTISYLNKSKCESIPFPLPPLAEQHRIIEKIDRLMEFCDRLEEAIEATKIKQTDLLNAVMSRV